MDEHKQNPPDPWDTGGAYGTGRTEPPKDRRGLVTLLLILIIFLGGIITVLGLLNVQMFRQLKDQPEEENTLSISFSSQESEPSRALAEPEVPAPTCLRDTIDLNTSPQSVANIPTQGGLSLQEIYAKNIGSVVSISAAGGRGTAASGTGVVVSDQGYIVTNCHVVQDALSIKVKLPDDRSFQATLIGQDPVSDLAVLFVEASDLQEAEFGDSSILRVGDTVAAIGDPLGEQLRGTMTDGIVSAINRNVTVGGRDLTLIQTNAALNSGNSGGPLINCYGQVIGINTMKIGTFTDEAGVEGLGFAIPSTTVKEIVDQIISQGYVSGRPTLGIRGEALSGFYQHYYRLPPGLFITEVDRGSYADCAGIQPGDILISIDNTRITAMEDLSTALYAYGVGDSVTLGLYSGGQQMTVKLILTESRG